MTILICGASGTLGSYLLERFLQQQQYPVIAWVRKPEALAPKWREHPQLEIWTSGLEALPRYAQALKKVSCLIHPATAWGGPDTFKINVHALKALLKQLEQGQCQHVHYFSSASIIDAQMQLQRAALQYGSAYIRSKAAMYCQLKAKDYPFEISTYFPTVILGGDDLHRWTAFSTGLKDLPRYLPLARFLSVSGGFHFIHAQDIAEIIFWRWQTQAQGGEWVLGNAWCEVETLLQELCDLYALNRPEIRLAVDRFAPVLLRVLRPWMSAWDRFSFRERQLKYKTVQSRDFGLPSVGESFTELLKVQGLV